MIAEHVVLVDEHNNPIGTMPKAEVHSSETPLHRGFSLFLFNDKGELLLQQRALSKKTFPGVWSNTVCGHPAEGEAPQAAASRRLSFELGLDIAEAEIHMILPDFRYTAEMQGIRENEFCPVMAVFKNVEPEPNPDEVEATQWVDWNTFVQTCQEKPETYSKWAVEEVAEMTKDTNFSDLLDKYIAKS